MASASSCRCVLFKIRTVIGTTSSSLLFKVHLTTTKNRLMHYDVNMLLFDSNGCRFLRVSKRFNSSELDGRMEPNQDRESDS